MIRGLSFFSADLGQKEPQEEPEPAVDADDVHDETDAASLAQVTASSGGEEASTEPDTDPPTLLGPAKQPRFDLESFLKVVNVLKSYIDAPPGVAEEGSLKYVSEEDVKNAFSALAEILVWADRNDSFIWEMFVEQRVMLLVRNCLSASHSRWRNSTSAAEKLWAETGSSPVSGRLAASVGRLQLSLSKPGPAHSEEGIAKASIDLRKLQAQYRQSVVDFQAHLLQTLAVVIQNVNRQETLYYLFSGNHINSIIEFEFEFESEEVLGFFMSVLRGISLKLDGVILQFFFDPRKGAFPLYSSAVRFFDHGESMVRIAVRNITLSIFSISQVEGMLGAMQSQGRTPYFGKLFWYLSNLFESVRHPLEVLLDDGAEVARTRQRTGIFRQSVQVPRLSARLIELENILLYIKDLYVLLTDKLQAEMRSLFETHIFAPLFKQLAVQASLNAAVASSGSWPLRLAQPRGGPAVHKLFVFDAAARIMLLTFLMTTVGESQLADHFVKIVRTPNGDVDGRSILHALKAIACDLTGTERVTYIALRALEVLMERRAFPADVTASDDSSVSESTNREPSPADERDEEPDEEPDEGATSENGDDIELNEEETDGSNLSGATSREPSASDARDESPASETEDGSKLNEEEIVTLFRTGESSLRDGLSSILLVARRRDVRTLRVVETVARIILRLGQLSKWKLSLDISMMILKDIATLLQAYVSDKRTTIVAIERAFTSFREGCAMVFAAERAKEDNALAFTSLQLVQTASTQPKHAGRVRRLLDSPMAPIELEDAVVFYCMARVHEHAAFQGEGDGVEGELCRKMRATFDGARESSSYLEKLEVLHALCDLIPKS